MNSKKPSKISENTSEIIGIIIVTLVIYTLNNIFVNDFTVGKSIAISLLTLVIVSIVGFAVSSIAWIIRNLF